MTDLTLPAINPAKVRWSPLVIILLVFLALQLPPILRVSIAQYDESIFLDIARNIHTTGLPLRSLGEDGKLELDQTPLYLYLLSGLTLIFGENLFILRLVTLVAAAGCIVLVYLIGHHVSGTAAGVVAGVLLAANPFFNLYSYFLRMEAFACFFVLLATYWLTLGHGRLTDARAAASGVAMATAVLLKVTSITFFIAAIPWAVWRLGRKPVPVRQIVWLTLPTITGVGLWFLAALLAPNRAASAGRWGAAIGLGGNGVDVRLNVELWNWLETIGRTVLGWETVALLAVALIAYAIKPRQRHPVAHLLVLYIILTIGLSLVVELKEARHLIGIIPAAAILIGVSIPWETLWERMSRQHPVVVAAGVFVALAVLFNLSPLRFPALSEMRQGEMWWDPFVRGRYFHNDSQLVNLRDSGIFLGSNSPDDAFILIARQGPVVGYYARRNYAFLYTGTFDRNMDLLRKNEYLVIDSPVDFWAQTPAETESLMQYVAENYSVIRVFDSGENVATLYRRNPPTTP